MSEFETLRAKVARVEALARVKALADEWECKADAIAITYQNADQRARATGWLRVAVRDLRAALNGERP